MSLDERRKALENEFFRSKDEENITKLRESSESIAKKESLSKASGITDDELLGKLIELGISEETLCAIRLVPMVVVAWADDDLHAREREAIMHGAEGYGIEDGSVAHDLLTGWLDSKPSAALFDAWEGYMATLKEHLTEEQTKVIKTQIIGRAHDVAKSAGGFLGVATESGPEKAMIEKLEGVF